MSWPFDDTEPRITPEAIVDFASKRLGLAPDDLALPTTMLATFQNGSHKRLLERTGARRLPIVEKDPRVEEGMAGSGKVLAGLTPRTRQTVAVALLPIGAPAAILFLELAIARGVRTILVCGIAGSLQPDLPIGSLVVVGGAEREDGTSHHYLPAGEVVVPDSGLVKKLAAASRDSGPEAVVGRSWTIDAVFRETAGAIARHQKKGVAVVDMEAAAIFALAKVRGCRAGLVVAVSDEVHRPWNPGFDEPAFRAAQIRAADVIIAAAEES